MQTKFKFVSVICSVPLLKNRPGKLLLFYDVHVLQLIHYARAYSEYRDLIKREKDCSLQDSWFRDTKKTKLVSTLKKLYMRLHNLDNPYNVAVSTYIWDIFASAKP